MNKIRIALASMFVFAAVAGMSAQTALQSEIQKAEQQCLDASGLQKKECKKEKAERSGKECKKGKAKCCKGGKDMKAGKKGHGPKGEGKIGRRGPGENPEMFQDLNLTPEQQAQVDALMKTRAEKFKASKAEAKEAKAQAKADRSQRMKADRQEFEAELQKILTPEQYATFQSRKSQMGPKGMKGGDRKAAMAGKAGKDGLRCQKDSVAIGKIQKTKAPKRR